MYVQHTYVYCMFVKLQRHIVPCSKYILEQNESKMNVLLFIE